MFTNIKWLIFQHRDGLIFEERRVYDNNSIPTTCHRQMPAKTRLLVILNDIKE